MRLTLLHSTERLAATASSAAGLVIARLSYTRRVRGRRTLYARFAIERAAGAEDENHVRSEVTASEAKMGCIATEALLTRLGSGRIPTRERAGLLVTVCIRIGGRRLVGSGLADRTRDEEKRNRGQLEMSSVHAVTLPGVSHCKEDIGDRAVNS